ncbi:leucyl aminopeptidase [Sphingomonas flavalba]|uniref:leucyl aminopeptidase n=1 Tax=Sphingomonas flavalba TaxID=2559804 RepID=UPI0039E0B15D
MHLSFASTRPAGADALALLVPGGGKVQVAGLAAEDAELVAAAIAGARFEGDAGTVAEVFARVDGTPRRVLLAGVGAGTPVDHERAGAALTARLLKSGAEKLVVDLTGGDVSAEAAAALGAGAVLRGWQYDVHRTRQQAKNKATLVEIVLVGAPDGSEAAWARADAVAQGVGFTRELVTEPANIIYPESFVERCLPLKDLGVEVTVLDEPAMRKLGMGALLGVAQGSARPPRLLALRWDGTGGAQDVPLALVGKGVTFDTGGISIKPAAGMEDMKWDMGGAGAVVGTIRALALRKAKAHVVGVCGLVENMPGGNAQRPGDVVTSMSGQTIEVINTDAEGRLVLSDALAWVQKVHKPRTIVDLATLTGAMIIALGHEHGGLFANDDSLADQLLAAGRASGDPLWRFPLGDAYNKLLDSQIADMKNVGPRYAGSITAAQFLQRFVNDGVRWAHLDIAGMVWADKPGAVWDKGATGYGVRLLDRFVADNFEK